MRYNLKNRYRIHGSNEIIFDLFSVPSLTFAMCVPAVCSMEFLQAFTNFTKRIKIAESNCRQVRNTGDEFGILDYVSM